MSKENLIESVIVYPICNLFLNCILKHDFIISVNVVTHLR